MVQQKFRITEWGAKGNEDKNTVSAIFTETPSLQCFFKDDLIFHTM